MYEMVENANQELELKYQAQRACISSHRFPYYESGTPKSPSEKWIERKKSDNSRQDLREQFNDKFIPRDSNSESKEPGIIGDERNLKQLL